ncbi:HD domain-containing protein [Janthinobacterium sp. GW460P]|uniref:HD domain-containing protein n=1 Tax=unclassified Janthinobacterium TaxID=2610881 RepID=UPI000A322D66|nr:MULTISPECIES: HD domain-containing protein [unclassified Janthinobacterium]MCC7701461.1 HD domain-containing protein [Janthinobacterium sp. GW460P]MCC7706968.1 HD domain-containing protein [Janthinobacterium sp. GW460W]
MSEHASWGTLERAIEIAAATHAGQTDKGGAPYILHPLRVMLRVAAGVQQIVAVLHDVVEDSDGKVTFDDLAREGFSREVIDGVRAVTKIEGELYEDFIARAALNQVGKAVKLADLAENSDLSRIGEPTQKDMERIEKYRRAIGYLRGDGS